MAIASNFEAIETGDINQIIAVVDAAFKKAAQEASERAHTKGILVVDGRANGTQASIAGRKHADR